MGRNIISAKLHIILKTFLLGNPAVTAYCAGKYYS